MTIPILRINSRRFILSVLAVIALTIVVVLHLQLDRLSNYQLTHGHYPLTINPQVIKLFSGGNERLVADIYWLAFLQELGTKAKVTKLRLNNEYQYLHTIVQLNPNFVSAYWFAAFALGGEGKRPDLSSQLLGEGIYVNPDNYYLPFIAGVNQFLFAANDKKAANYYQLASTYPQAPAWLKRQSLLLRAHIPTIIKQLNTWLNVYHNSADSRIQNTAVSKIVPLLIYIYHHTNNAAFRKRVIDTCREIQVSPESILIYPHTTI